MGLGRQRSSRIYASHFRPCQGVTLTHPYMVRLKSALLAGTSAGLFTPLLWPLVILGIQGRIVDCCVVFRGLVAVSAFAVAIGLIVAVVAAFPLLLLRHKFGVDGPLVVVCAGALIGTLTLSKFMSWPGRFGPCMRLRWSWAAFAAWLRRDTFSITDPSRVRRRMQRARHRRR
jgi:hypothetical protein